MSAIIYKFDGNIENDPTTVWQTDNINSDATRAAGVTAFLTEPLAGDEHLIATFNSQVHPGAFQIAERRIVSGADTVIITNPRDGSQSYPTASAANAIAARMGTFDDGTAPELPGSPYRSP